MVRFPNYSRHGNRRQPTAECHDRGVRHRMQSGVRVFRVRLGAPRATKRLVLGVLLVAATLTWPHGARGQVACRIVEADASAFADIDQGGVVTYYGQIIMSTRDCGLSPAEVQGTFRPVAGTTTTCDFRGSLQSDDAVCTQAHGLAASGTPMVIEAIGRTFGSGGVDAFISSCTLIVTPPSPGAFGGSLSRASCPLPLE